MVWHPVCGLTTAPAEVGRLGLLVSAGVGLTEGMLHGVRVGCLGARDREEGFTNLQHEYTRTLLFAVPRINQEWEQKRAARVAADGGNA